MNQNPQIVSHDDGYIIRYIRNSYKVLVWVQDLSSRKMKSEIVDRPLVHFLTMAEAEKEVKNIVIPYFLKEKDVRQEEIFGW